MISVAKTAELILMMLDVTKGDSQRRLLELELEAIGIRLNQKQPDIVFKPKVRISPSPTSLISLLPGCGRHHDQLYCATHKD